MINLIFTKVDGEKLFSAYQLVTDGSHLTEGQNPMEYFNDINEFSNWVKARGGQLGQIINHPIVGRCRLAEIEAITINDAFLHQVIYDFKSTDIYSARI